MKTGNEPSDRKSNKSDIFVESFYPGTQVIAELYAHDTEIKISLGCMITPIYGPLFINYNFVNLTEYIWSFFFFETRINGINGKMTVFEGSF